MMTGANCEGIVESGGEVMPAGDDFGEDSGSYMVVWCGSDFGEKIFFFFAHLQNGISVESVISIVKAGNNQIQKILACMGI